jgi:flagellar basal body-associated protein FliL
MKKKISILFLLVFINCLAYPPLAILYADLKGKEEREKKEEDDKNCCLLYILVKTNSINSLDQSLSEYDKKVKCGLNNDFYISPCTAPVNSL